MPGRLIPCQPCGRDPHNSRSLQNEQLLAFYSRIRSVINIRMRNARFARAGRLSGTGLALAGLLLMLTHAATADPVERLSIVANGSSRYEIVVAHDALPTTRLAATELRYYIEMASNARLPIVSKPSAGRDQIFISAVDELKPHGFAIQAYGKNLYLRGRDSGGAGLEVSYTNPIHRGTCNAVYAFLERFAGVRWYWSDYLGEIVPSIPSISVPGDLVLKEEPFFDYRALVYGPPGSADGDWARRARLGSAIGMHHGHALHKIIPVAEWARKGHPEYAAWRGGERRTRPASGASGGHVCTSNEDVIHLVADAAVRSFDSHPNQAMFSISLPDGSGVCAGDQCTALDVPGYKIKSGVHRNWPVITDRILTFYNAVAELVEEKHPDRYLGTYIYMDYLFPPKRVRRVHPQVVLLVAPNQSLEIWRDDAWSFTQDLYRFWGGFHDKVYAYDTPVLPQRSYGLPAPLGARSADLVRLFADAGSRGAYLYIGQTWESIGPEAYVYAKLLWNPHEDVDRITREYYGLLYQSAADPVRAYFETAADCWKEATTHDRAEIDRLAKSILRTRAYARQSFAELVVGYGPRLDEMERLVAEAERLAASDALVAKRVARIRDNFTLTRTTLAGLKAVFDYEGNPQKKPARLIPLLEAVATREDLLGRIRLSYGRTLFDSLRLTDARLESPLEFGGYYYKIARRALAAQANGARQPAPSP